MTMKLFKYTTLALILSGGVASAGCPPGARNCTPWPPFPEPEVEAVEAVDHSAVITTLGGLSLPNLAAGEAGWAVGLGATQDSEALGVGFGYGIRDNLSVQLKAAASEDTHAVYLGLSGTF